MKYLPSIESRVRCNNNRCQRSNSSLFKTCCITSIDTYSLQSLSGHLKIKIIDL